MRGLVKKSESFKSYFKVFRGENLEEGGEFNGEAQSDEEFAIQQQQENFSGNF